MTEWSAGTTLRHLHSAAGLADPYAVYRTIRRAAESGHPVRRILHRHRDVRAALEDRTLRSDRVSAILRPLPAADRASADVLEHTLRHLVVFADQPDHRRLRRLLAYAFTPRAVEMARPAIAAAADCLLDRLDAGDGPVDLHGAVSYQLPAVVLADLLGIPPDTRDAFRSWATDLVRVVGSGRLTPDLTGRANRSAGRTRALVSRLVRQRLADGRHTGPPADLLDAMLAAAVDEERLSLDELCANTLFLMAAGHDTAANMMSNAVLTLLRHPDQFDRLRADRSLLPAAVDETLRYESAVQIAARVTGAPRELGGMAMAAGESVILLIGAANRDPDVFVEPDRFDIARTPNPHLAFGHGIHFCLGAALARAELETLLARLCARYRSIRLVEEEIEWQRTLDFRGPTRLLVRCRKN